MKKGTIGKVRQHF